MAKIIEKIVQSKTAPKQTNVVWDDGKTLNIFRNGKWVSTGLSSEQQDMVQKLLDSYGDLPENLDSIKELANTPTDFLNHNPELGGIINMPFGYQNLGYARILTYDYKGDALEDVDCGKLESAYFGKVLIYSPSLGTQSDIYIFNIDDITGKDNKKNIYGPISIYYLDGHIYISSYNYTPLKINFVAFSGYKKLPLGFTTPYIVGNDTQEHLDELKKLCFTSNPKEIPMMIIKSEIGELVITNVLLGGPPHFWIFQGLDKEGNKIVIKLPSKDISTLEINQHIEDIGGIVTTTPINITPDWNAIKGEDGYIANKYFGIGDIHTTFYFNENNTIEIDNAGRGYEYLCYPTMTGGSRDVYFKIIKIDFSRNFINIPLDAYNTGARGEIEFYIKNDGSLFELKFYGNSDFRKFPIYLIGSGAAPIPISDPLIPDTIARKDDYEALEARVAELEAKLNEITVTVDK